MCTLKRAKRPAASAKVTGVDPESSTRMRPAMRIVPRYPMATPIPETRPRDCGRHTTPSPAPSVADRPGDGRDGLVDSHAHGVGDAEPELPVAGTEPIDGPQAHRVRH